MPSAAAATPRRGFGKVAGLLRETMFKNLCGSYGNTTEGNQGEYKESAPAGQPLREIFHHPTAQQGPPPDDMNTNRGFQCIRGQDSDEVPEAMRVAVKTARRRSWQNLANERIENTKPTIPLGKRFWPLGAEERSEITHLFEKEHVRQLATMLRSRKDNAPVGMLDAAYWKKGCSSLGSFAIACCWASETSSWSYV
jgi:hypothetical protein